MFLIVFTFTENKREKWLYSEILVARGSALMGEGGVESGQNSLENLENIPYFLNADKPKHKMDVPPTPKLIFLQSGPFGKGSLIFWHQHKHFCWPWIPCRWLFGQAWRYGERVNLFVGSLFPIAPCWDVLEPFILCWVVPTKPVLLQCFHLHQAEDYLGLWFFCFPGNLKKREL